MINVCIRLSEIVEVGALEIPSLLEIIPSYCRVFHNEMGCVGATTAS